MEQIQALKQMIQGSGVDQSIEAVRSRKLHDGNRRTIRKHDNQRDQDDRHNGQKKQSY